MNRKYRQSAIAPRILEALSQFGPMTAVELAATPQCRAHTAECLRKRLAFMVREDALQEAFILMWVHDAEGERSYPRPVYAAGRGKNKPRPRPKTRSEIVVAWKQKRRAQTRTNFVFNLGAKT